MSWVGGPVDERTVCVLAANPGPMTLDGTNTWVLHDPAASDAIVVDPGPLDEVHLRAVLDVVRSRGAEVSVALLTHRHGDHADGARRFSELAGCPVRAVDPAHRYGSGGVAGGGGLAGGLADGEVVAAGGLALTVVATPGHTSDSVSFLLPAVGAMLTGAMLTGDTVLGRGTTVVAHPDGALAPYLASLRRLRGLVSAPETQAGSQAGSHSGSQAGSRAGSQAGSPAGSQRDPDRHAPGWRILPGHGPVLDDAKGTLDGYLAHRAERLAQVRAAVAAGARTPREVVERVYADVDPVVWPAAELSVRAQLDYLAEQSG